VSRITLFTVSLLVTAHALTGCCCPSEDDISTTDINTREDGAGSSPRGEGPAQGSDIHAIDFRNREYTHGDLGTFRTVDGEFSKTVDDDIIVSFSVGSVVYGDIDGKPGDEAVVITNFNGGGTGQFDDASIYTMKGGEAVQIATIPGGDRGDGGLDSVVVNGGGKVTVKRLHSTDDDGACCPSQLKIESWRWSGGTLKLDASKTRTEPFSE